MLTRAPWQYPSSALAPPRSGPGGSGRLDEIRGVRGGGVLGGPSLLRFLDLVVSNVASPIAFDPPGVGAVQT